MRVAILNHSLRRLVFFAQIGALPQGPTASKRLVLMGFMRSPHRLRGKNHGRAAIAPGSAARAGHGRNQFLSPPF
ncbi:protein of unknown function [Methylocella tundrae]|uniref:Uncharacterized protein n=1 Tax=Methylocella tundrae TaxID=227605 RepID=A0A4U8Z4M1_METTU|nr:protein of unknown function [Methylocella tundrae]